MEPVQREPWPVGRSGHAACCLNYGQVHPQLLMYGGVNNDSKTLKDMWILDVDTGQWTEVRIVVYRVSSAGCIVSLLKLTPRVCT